MMDSIRQIENPTLNYFYQKYKPAASFAEAELFLGTADILRRLLSFDAGLDMDMPKLRIWLTENGYTFDTLSEMNIVWLLKEDA